MLFREAAEDDYRVLAAPMVFQHVTFAFLDVID
jgi:hypothetical protein